MSRIDEIGQNGNTGEHYIVEGVARIIAGDQADRVLGSKNRGKKGWELHVQQAIKILEYLEKVNA